MGGLRIGVLSFNDSRRVLKLGVQDLIEHGPPGGDLRVESVRSRSVRARAGQDAHRAWQSERAAGEEQYCVEHSLTLEFEVSGWQVTLSGRVDGLFRVGEHTIVEELKSTALWRDRLDKVDVNRVPAWKQQVQVYLWMLQELKHPGPVGRLVLISLVDGSQRLMHIAPEASIGEWVRERLDWFIARRERWLVHRDWRRAVSVPFAYTSHRPLQRELSEKIEGALADGQHVLFQAPTGFGKTAAVLDAALRVALRNDKRVFFATARTTQQRMAEATLETLAERGLTLRSVTLRAREKGCLNAQVSCRPEECRFAEGHHDRVRKNELVRRLQATGAVDPAAVREMSELHTVCPVELAFEYAADADVVIGDCSYVLDPDVRPGRLLGRDLSEWIVVFDEAHNLPDRARGWSSPTISTDLATKALESLSTRGESFHAFVTLAQGVIEALDPRALVALGPRFRDGAVSVDFDRERFRALARSVDERALDYILACVQSGHPPVADDPYLELSRGLLRFERGLEREDGNWPVLFRQEEGLRRLTICCLDTGAVIGPYLETCAGSIHVSATLAPFDLHARECGLDVARVGWVDAPGFFTPDQLGVLVCPDVSTEYRHRAADRDATAAIVEEVVRAVPGNCAILFSSFAFRDQVLEAVSLDDRVLLLQRAGMSEDARDDLLHELKVNAPPRVLAKVLGGIFAEGVDLPGDCLEAVVIVGPGLPALTAERELLRAWMVENGGEGFHEAYVVPGMRRVVQAAGRVVRTERDKGVVVLVGRRFGRVDYTRLFPEQWEPTETAWPWLAVREFFSERKLSTGLEERA